MGIVVGLLILSVMMVVHELGHYLTGRRLGFTIEEFSVFMGPVLFSWTRNQIKYSIKLLPIGASVRFAGEYDEDSGQSKDPGWFFNRPKWARALVIGTGPALNLLSGVLALILMFSVFGYTVPVLDDVPARTLAATAGLVRGDRILRVNGQTVRTTLDYSGAALFIGADTSYSLDIRGADGQTRQVGMVPALRDRYRLGIDITTSAGQKGAIVSSVDPQSNNGSPVLQPKDILLTVEGIPYEDYPAFAAAIESSAGAPIGLTVIRGGETVSLTMAATRYREPVPSGINFQARKDFLPAVGQAFMWPWSLIKLTLRSISMMFAGTIRPQDALSGPVGVVTLISDVVSQQQPLAVTINQLLSLFALISVSLGFMNLLPIPPLDGNHLLLIVVEAIRGRRLSLKVQNLIGVAGIVLIVLLAVAGLTFDIMRLLSR